MSYTAIRSPIKEGLDCYLLAIPAWRLKAFLGHDPRSHRWKDLAPWLRGIYETKQRVTQKARVDALDKYIVERLMDDVKFGAFPPISVIQFEPLETGQVTPVRREGALLDEDSAFVIGDGHRQVNRVLIDGLARATAVIGVQERLQAENPSAFERISSYVFSVALYVPTGKPVGADVAGQLFTDFNSYAWPVSTAKTISDDIYNPYKIVAGIVDQSDVLRRHGGLKVGTANLGKKDTAFTTELAMAQVCKVAIEGRRGYGKLTKPISNPRVASLDLNVTGRQIAEFLGALEQAMGSERFADRAQLFRTAHGLYALAVVMNDVLFEKRASLQQTINGLASIDWTWNNPKFRDAIGRNVEPHVDAKGRQLPGGWKLNTGGATMDWLVGHCRDMAGIMLRKAA